MSVKSDRKTILSKTECIPTETKSQLPAVTDYHLIDADRLLLSMAAELGRQKVVAVDLEADSLHHFTEKVCLIQIATPRDRYIIDPLRLADLSPLKPFFASPKIKKIFHGADYDVRSLFRDFEIEIHNLFDTELASRFLGVTESGLEAVLGARFGVTLIKKFRKRDWTQRPLPLEMMCYAVGDVAYLIDLVRQLESELKRKRRFSWVMEECELLSRVRPANNNHGPLCLHLKGAGRLDPLSLAVLEALLQYRRKIAHKKDRPLFKVIGNRALLTLSAQKPTSLKSLRNSGALSKKQVEMYGECLVAIVHSASRTPPAERPVFPRHRAPRLNPKVPDRINLLKMWRDRKAQFLQMDPALVCNRAQLTAIAVKNPRTMADLQCVEGLKAWQCRAFGRSIVAILAKQGNR